MNVYTQRVKIGAKRMDTHCFSMKYKVPTSHEVFFHFATFYFCLKYMLLVILKTGR